MKVAVDQAEKQRMVELAEVARRVIREKNLTKENSGEDMESNSAFTSLIAELHNERSRLNALAFTDGLTGVANRRLFIEHAETVLRSTKRRGSVMALAYIDVDDFKDINSTFGKEKADQLLVEVGRRLKDSVREVDTVARLGGDEFTVILQDVGSKTFVERLINRIYATLLEPVDMGNGDLCAPTCSIAVVLSDGIEDLGHIMARAEGTMYAVKQGGKNRYLVRDLFDDE